MLFFNPGKKIKGLPFMSGKTAIYDDEMADAYDMEIDMDENSRVTIEGSADFLKYTSLSTDVHIIMLITVGVKTC